MEHYGVLGLSAASRVRRSVISLRRNQVVAVDHGHGLELEDLNHFQNHVAARFLSLLPATTRGGGGAGGPEHDQQLLSLPFLGKLLDAFLLCEEEFRALLLLVLARDPAVISRPPMDRLVSDHLDRAVKALDICNAVTDAIACLCHCLRHADIAASAVQQHPPGSSQRPVCEGQLNPARKALTNLLGSMYTNPDELGGKTEKRAWSLSRSYGRHHGNNSYTRSNSEGHLRTTLSWSVSRSWSASKQLHAMSAGLALPRGAADAGSGLALAVYTMSSVLVFTMWALVAALPCQDRGTAPATLPVVALPGQLPWTTHVVVLQERITAEWKRRERRGSAGLLAELQGMERSARGLLEREAGSNGWAERAEELSEARRKLGEGLGPLERQVRGVFHRVTRSRTEVQQLLEQSSRSGANAASSDLKVKRKHQY